NPDSFYSSGRINHGCAQSICSFCRTETNRISAGRFPGFRRFLLFAQSAGPASLQSTVVAGVGSDSSGASVVASPGTLQGLHRSAAKDQAGTTSSAHFFFSWPQAAEISLPRFLRTKAEML